MATPQAPPVDRYDLSRNDLEKARSYNASSGTIQTVVGRHLVEQLMKIASGQRVIEFGCGPGNLAFPIADIVRGQGYVFGFDPLADCIAVARDKIIGQYAKIVEFEVGRAEAVPQSAGTDYDHAVLSSMIHWTEQDKALKQAFRVLKAGGCVGISTIPGDFTPPWDDIKQRVLAQEAYRQLNPNEGRAAHPTEIKLTSNLDKAGFINIHSEVKTHRFVWPDAEALMEWLETSSFNNFLPRAPANIEGDELKEIEELILAARKEMIGLFKKEYGVSGEDKNKKPISMDTKILYAIGYKGQ